MLLLLSSSAGETDVTLVVVAGVVASVFALSLFVLVWQVGRLSSAMRANHEKLDTTNRLLAELVAFQRASAPSVFPPPRTLPTATPAQAQEEALSSLPRLGVR